MKPYSDFSAEELAMEGLFIRWILYPQDEKISAFWEKWISRHPQMGFTVIEARGLVQNAANWEGAELPAGEVNALWARIRNSIEQIVQTAPPSNYSSANPLKKYQNGFFILLAIIGTLALLWVLLKK